ncbi:MAG: GNAT family N-acetyltransferase, partial [Proteobacteria bacterium]|nr:GNAT family N-acetyltransferase [Pseudomonadota bacterium]
EVQESPNRCREVIPPSEFFQHLVIPLYHNDTFSIVIVGNKVNENFACMGNCPRVVIKEAYRRKGYGTKIYKYLEDFFIKDLIPICCEVNSFPRNEVSINFHIKNGFECVGGHDFDDRSVIYFRKIYIK